MSAMDDRLGLVIKRAEQALIARKTAALREFGLTVPQYAALLLLTSGEGAGMSAAQLARESLVTPQTMATVLTNLEAKGLIERGPSPLHQKVVVNRVTPAGAALLKDADVAALTVEKRLADAFTDIERRQLAALLERAITGLAP
ncbi:MarR family transcriptional regulator [Actinoplanes sp. NEAU-A12]|uniref:MarR family transcriptional regulator n=1 Tax=Actinoplanes sandaracinus TaxID=3045177 RepID=A0ABT6WPV5_9ACTN|nr:MarR family transcriptional regulator [Actinoplanes sandaracinus]MDI6101714.1 MarR family transcriptional regulator [Actinoplanes sandaracinus]